MRSQAASPKIVLIAPYPELGAMARKISGELGVDIEVMEGVLRIGVKIAQDMESRGVEVLITRGGTIIESLKSGVKIPIVEIEVTGYDVLRALYKARQISDNIGLIDYENIVSLSNSALIENLLKVKIQRSIIRHHAEIEETISKLTNFGVQVIVGGGQVTKTCEALGIRNVLIESDLESIRHAMTNAIAVLEARKIEREKSNQLKAILDFAYEGILATDAKGRITTLNSSAAKLMNIQPDRAIGRRAEDVFPGIGVDEVLRNATPQTDSIYHIKNLHIACNKVPIKTVGDEIAGVLVTFQDVVKIQQLEKKIRKELAARGLVAKYSFANIIGESQEIKDAISIARRYSAVDSTVLITGETGTGKELVAHGIHMESKRKDGPFVAVNCAALPETLLESELFGYVEGAFTDARRGGKAGLIELAHGGTLFLDEIGEISLKIQARLLRVLQEKEVMRIGDDKVIPVDIRVIAATNKDLWTLVEDGRFREDLYYRINVLTLRMPALRERPGDIALLADYFLRMFSDKHGRPPMSLSKGALRVLFEYDFPGNVRELMNILERLVVLSDTLTIPEDLARRILSEYPQRRRSASNILARSTAGLGTTYGSGVEAGMADSRATNRDAINGDTTRGLHKGLSCIDVPQQSAPGMRSPGGSQGGILHKMERELVMEILRQENFSRSRAAKRLGISTTTLWRWLKEMRA